MRCTSLMTSPAAPRRATAHCLSATMRSAKVGVLSICVLNVRADNLDRPRLLPATAYVLNCRRRPRGHEAGDPTRTRLTRAGLRRRMQKAPGGYLDGASRMSAILKNAVSGHSCVGFGKQSAADVRKASD